MGSDVPAASETRRHGRFEGEERTLLQIFSYIAAALFFATAVLYALFAYHVTASKPPNPDSFLQQTDFYTAFFKHARSDFGQEALILIAFTGMFFALIPVGLALGRRLRTQLAPEVSTIFVTGATIGAVSQLIQLGSHYEIYRAGSGPSTATITPTLNAILLVLNDVVAWLQNAAFIVLGAAMLIIAIDVLRTHAMARAWGMWSGLTAGALFFLAASNTVLPDSPMYRIALLVAGAVVTPIWLSRLTQQMLLIDA
jgi:Domain of unknown function (DUF4386)